MAIPDITHLQFLILAVLYRDGHSGRFIRDRLAEEGSRQSGPAFYQMMARLEAALLVCGWYESYSVDGQTIKERKYEITPVGKRAFQEVQSFYATRDSGTIVQGGSVNTSN